MSLSFALNHMTAARMNFVQLLDLAVELGCVGIELRNDLPQPLFDGMPAADAGAMIRDKGLRLLALAEVKRFNRWSADKASEAQDLIDIAAAAGAEAVSLIPRNDNGGMNNGERQANLRVSLRDLLPRLQDAGLRGFVEPLGFEICALRHKQEAVDAFTALETGTTFQLVHDTFHHYLAGNGALFAAHTGLVHISGVADPSVAPNDMTDAHRALVDQEDRLGNIDQIRALHAAGYAGPVSFEAFSPKFHAIEDPATALRTSMDFMRTTLRADAA